MREIRKSGSEGGEGRLSLPLSGLHQSRGDPTPFYSRGNMILGAYSSQTYLQMV